MNKHTFAALIAAGLLSTAGAAQADPVFPSAGIEGHENSSPYVLTGDTMAVAAEKLTGAHSTFPSAGIEGYENNGQYVRGPRNLEHSYAGGQGSVFPSAAIE
jgi:hypothetical protein